MFSLAVLSAERIIFVEEARYTASARSAPKVPPNALEKLTNVVVKIMPPGVFGALI